MGGYDFRTIETKWQDYWREHETFRVSNPGQDGFDPSKPKMYVLDMFPYPSGAGLHVGHPEGYTATDIVCRYLRMKGYNVLHPMGYDAFGLPAEQYAVEHGVHPRETTEANIANIERQIKMFGFSYDWSRRLATTDVGYYRWTQWIFLQLFNSYYDPAVDAARPIRQLIDRLLSGELLVDLAGQVVFPEPGEQASGEFFGMTGTHRKFAELDDAEKRAVIDEHRLAYMAEVPVNWCPKLGTVLANEEVTNEGRSERGDHPVYRRSLKQWMLRITAYAERLLKDLEAVDWPEPIKIMQRNWIGRSDGAEVDFPVCGGTGFQPVSSDSKSFLCASADENFRPWLNALDFEGMDPYPKGQPSSPDMIKSIRNLPHIILPGATYFVTFRVKDGRRLSEADRQVVMDSILYWHKTKCLVFAAVVLDDHVHMVVKPTADNSLSQLLQSIKRHSAREINKKNDRNGSLWQDENFDHIIRDTSWFTKLIYYICENPVKKELISRFSDYPWLFINKALVITEDNDSFGHSLQSCATRDMDEWFEDRKNGGFPVVEEDGVIRVYTTRPDTLYGTTYMVLAPEHPLVEQITTPQQRDEVRAYVTDARNRSELDRLADTKEKTGVFTGAYAINPVNRQRIPIWVADYVMMGYGTGAIMAVPAHDERDFAFAMNFRLPITPILKRRDEADARYCAGTNHGEFMKIYEVFQHNPDAFTELRGIDFGPVVHENSGNTPFVPNAAHEKFFDLDDTPKLWIFVGPTAHRDAATLAGLSSHGRAVPRCNVSMDEDHEFINSGPLNGLSPAEGKKAITTDLETSGMGRRAVNYKLRDWLFSRQRYWGEPFPIIHCKTCGTVPLPEDQLPLRLPAMDDFSPDSTDDPSAPPQPPLGKANGWVDAPCPNCGQAAKRELNTMPQWAGSCWYYLRYLDPNNDEQFVSPKAERYWMGRGESGGVDLYVGGAEHAVLHLLYARFWHKVLYDLGHVSTPEPFGKLFNQGMIRSFAYRDERGVYVAYDDIDFRDDGAYHKKTGKPLTESVEKMSKSLRNVVNPDDVIEQYGADAFRLYEMFMGPLEASKPWNTRDVPGVFRFLQRVWRMTLGDKANGITPLIDEQADESPDIEKALHRLIKKVAEDVEAMKFNTAIAAMMDFVNNCYRAQTITKDQALRFVRVLNPFAPHITEEIAEQLGRPESLAYEPWPTFDEEMIEEETVKVPVQINGKVRSRVSVPSDADDETMIELALADRKIAPQVAGKKIVKQVVVSGRLVSLVVK